MTYSDELAAVADAFETSLASFGDSTVARIRETLQGRTLTVVGSGGTLAVAELFAFAHRNATGHFAETATPLGFAESRVHGEVAVFVSARAKHPDTAFAIRHAVDSGREVILLTQKRRSELAPTLTHPRVFVATIPTSDRPDGFLATTSIASMAGAIAQIYDLTKATLEACAAESAPADLTQMRNNTLVLHSEIGLPAARDIETRLHELGLASVQLADYRNFGHGRHVGLARNSDTTTVVALLGPPATLIAERTLSVLPAGTDVRRIQTSYSSVAGAVSLMLRVLPIPRDRAARAGVEPSKPKVASFGRKLYHLSSARALPSHASGPVERKVAASGLLGESAGLHKLYADAFATWRRQMQRQVFAGVLLDYDGTCVATSGRWELPDPSFQRSMMHALDAGLRVGFASGRGKSLYNDLRQWLPERYWSSVELALHNGSWFQSLADSLSKPEIASLTSEVEEALRGLELAGIATLDASGAQLSVLGTHPGMPPSALRALVQSLLPEDVAVRVQVVSSAHSVDIVPASSGKRAALEHLEAAWGQLYVIGDRGEPGGNDFDLLDSRQWTMTVDRCSTRLDRCWPVTMANNTGPSSVSAILLGSRAAEEGVRLQLPTIPKVRR